MMKTVKLVNWNIGNSSSERLPRQIDYLISKAPDIIILTEVGNKEKVNRIGGLFNKFGYLLFSNDNYIDKYAVLILVKNVYNSKLYICRDAYSRSFAIKTNIYEQEFVVLGTYFPSNNRKLLEKKKNHCEKFFTLLDSISHENIIIAGDFNSVKQTHIPQFKWFRSWEYEIFTNLEERKYIDASSLFNELQYSWFGNKGIGHLYDYCFLSQAVSSNILICHYDHIVCEKKLSDHALQYIEIKI